MTQMSHFNKSACPEGSDLEYLLLLFLVQNPPQPNRSSPPFRVPKCIVRSGQFKVKSLTFMEFLGSVMIVTFFLMHFLCQDLLAKMIGFAFSRGFFRGR